MTLQFGSTLSAASALRKDEDCCANCSTSREHLLSKVSSATRKVSCMTAVCCVLCLLTLSACGCTIYMYTQIQTFRQDLISLVRKGVNSPDDVIAYAEALSQNDGEIPMYGGDHKEDFIHRPRRTATPSKLEKKKKPKARKNKTISHVYIHVNQAHYTSEVDENFIIKELGAIDSGNVHNTVMEKWMDAWNGTLYRNKTFSTPNQQLTLKFFKEAPWVQNISSDRIFDQNIPGIFVARYSGLYHLYAHVTFYNAIQPGVAMSHEGGGITTNVLACNHNATMRILEAGKSSNYQACNINGVLYMEKGHIIKVTISCPNIILDMQKATTYFGGRLLTKATAIVT